MNFLKLGLIFVAIVSSLNASESNFGQINPTQEFFQVWNRPEYKEWAKPIAGGYLLYIIRTEKGGNHLTVKAKLIIKDKGLPGFEVIEQHNYSDFKEALEQINNWNNSETI